MYWNPIRNTRNFNINMDSKIWLDKTLWCVVALKYLIWMQMDSNWWFKGIVMIRLLDLDWNEGQLKGIFIFPRMKTIVERISVLALFVWIE